MVVGVLPHVIEIVVLAAGADALLGVAGAAQAAKLRVRGGSAEKHRLELVHSGVGEQQRGVVDGDHGARRPSRVRLRLVVLDESFPDPPSRPLRRRLHRRSGSGGGERGEVDGGGRQNPSGGLGEEEHPARAREHVPLAVDGAGRG